jgi:nucleotide-binding universal stress UspA family protein
MPLDCRSLDIRLSGLTTKNYLIMGQILITTDFSENAAAAIRFGLQLATQGGFKLVFMHVTEILKPVKWTEEFFRDFEQKELAGLEQQLKAQVMEVSAGTGSTVIDPRYVVRNSSSVPANVVHYAAQHNIRYICMARKGGGHTTRLFGSVASTLIEKSIVPVIAVPENYQLTSIDVVCYASDLANLNDELKDVLEFSNAVKASSELLHFSSPVDETAGMQDLAEVQENLARQQVVAHIEALDFDKPLVDRLAEAVERFSPSILVMFTRQNRSFFERLFLSSVSAEFAATSAIPLLVYRKKN